MRCPKGHRWALCTCLTKVVTVEQVFNGDGQPQYIRTPK